MKSTVVHISSRTLQLLAAAAREHNIPVWRHASLCAMAAARLWKLDPHTAAVPRNAPAGEAPADLELHVEDSDFEVLSTAARHHCLALPIQVRAVLDMAVHNYEPAPPDRRRDVFGNGGAAAADPGGVMHRPPFDPKTYAHGAVAALQAARPKAPRRASLTAELMGDPAFGTSTTAKKAGASADRFVMPEKGPRK